MMILIPTLADLGLAVLSNLRIQLWRRESNCDGVVKWVMLQKIIQLEGLLPQGMDSYEKLVYMVGYDEDSNEVVLATYVGDFMLQLDSRRFRRFSKSKEYPPINITTQYPYRNFYTAGMHLYLV
jgi:hypothetical protein